MIVDSLDVVCPECGHDCKVSVLDIISWATKPSCDACGASLGHPVKLVTAQQHPDRLNTAA